LDNTVLGWRLQMKRVAMIAVGAAMLMAAGCKRPANPAMGDGEGPVLTHQYEITITNESSVVQGDNRVMISLYQEDAQGAAGPMLINRLAKDYHQTAAYPLATGQFGQRFTVWVANGDASPAEFQGRVKVALRDVTSGQTSSYLTADEYVAVHGKGPKADAKQDFVVRWAR
jgi:hypothetical protein